MTQIGRRSEIRRDDGNSRDCQGAGDAGHLGKVLNLVTLPPRNEHGKAGAFAMGCAVSLRADTYAFQAPPPAELPGQGAFRMPCQVSQDRFGG